MNKSRDFVQAFQRLTEKYHEFLNESTMDKMERIEIEAVIQQINRLHDKLDKHMNIIGRKFSR